MRPTLDPFRLLLISLAGWLNQQQQDIIDLWFAKISSATKPGAIRPRLSLQREREFGQGWPGGAPSSLGVGTRVRRRRDDAF